MVGLPGLVRWSVYRDGEEIERVSYTREFTAEDVRMSLIEHDGYEDTIEVREAKLD